MFRVLLLCAPVIFVPGACNAAASADMPAHLVVAQLTDSSGCSATIARYRAVAQSDAQTGNVNASVYAQIDREIRTAEIACAAGRESEARALIAGSKSRHGYPAGN